LQPADTVIFLAATVGIVSRFTFSRVKSTLRQLRQGDKQPDGTTGRIDTYAGVEAYIAGANKERAILFATDIFGHRFLNNQKCADDFAADFTDVIPKSLNDAADSNDPNFVAKLGEWFARNPASNATNICRTVLTQMLKDFKSLQIVGFCYGGRMVADLIPSVKSLKAGVFFHPSMLKPEDAPLLKAAGTPLYFACAETDQAFHPPLRAVYEDELKGANGIFKEYPGTQHGFGIRPSGEQAQKSCEEARKDVIAFFQANA
jgi:dienelactone hydrolase